MLQKIDMCLKNPNWPWFDCMNIGLERPITLTAGTSYHVQLIVDDTISGLYVNGVALNARMYTQTGDALNPVCSRRKIGSQQLFYCS